MNIVVKEIPTEYRLNWDLEWECTHPNNYIDSVDIDTSTYKVYICAECDTIIDGDPEGDYWDSEIDRQIMEMRGK